MKQSGVILRGSIQSLTHFKSNSCYSVYSVLGYWIITVNSCQEDHWWWSDFWPQNWLSFRAAPPCKPASAQAHGSQLSRLDRLTLWRQGSAGKMVLLPIMCLELGGHNSTADGGKKKWSFEKDPSPCDLKMARLADYFVVVGYDLEKRGGFSC